MATLRTRTDPRHGLPLPCENVGLMNHVTKITAGKLVGKGAYGQVFAIEHEGKTLAVKVFKLFYESWTSSGKKMIIDHDGQHDFDEEIKVFDALYRETKRYPARTQYLIKMVCQWSGYQEGEEMHYIAMPAFEMNLYQYNRRYPFKLENAWEILLQLARGLRNLHSLGFLHRDMKMSNVLVNRVPGKDLPSIVITDYGLAKELPGVAISVRLAAKIEFDPATDDFGTTFNRPPEMRMAEVHKRKIQYGVEVDWWALGVIVLDMCMGLDYLDFLRSQKIHAYDDRDRFKSMDPRKQEMLIITQHVCGPDGAAPSDPIVFARGKELRPLYEGLCRMGDGRFGYTEVCEALSDVLHDTTQHASQ